MKFAFCTRCGGDYGWGHWIRTLNLIEGFAQRYPNAGIKVFYEGLEKAETIAADKLDDLSSITIAKTNLNNPCISKDDCFDVVLMDRLEHDKDSLMFWRNHSGVLAVFDDMGLVDKGAGIIIRPQLVHDGGVEVKEGRLLYGPKYLPVHPSWQRLRESYDLNKANRIVVNLGGGTTNTAGYLLTAKALRDSKSKAPVTFAVGYDLCESDLPEQLTGILSDARITGSADLPELMRHAKPAIVAGGLLKYELASAGVPAIILSGPDHQATLSNIFAGTGAGIYAGAIDQLSHKTFAQMIDKLLENDRKLAEISQAGRNLVDGRGRKRIIDELTAGFES